MKVKQIAVSVISLFSVVGGLYSITGCTQKQEQKKTEEVKKVETATPRLDVIDIVDSYTANVEAFVKNNIAPQTPNRIDRIMVEVGQHVQKGQVLATLDNASLKQQELRLQNLRADFQRTDELYKVGGISKAQYEAQKMNYEITESTYNNLKDNTLLRSPISGIITQRNYDSGDMYSPTMPLLVVEQIAPLKLSINASEKYFTRIRKGMEVDITLDVFPNETFKGTIGLIHPTIDPNTRTFKVEIHIKNADNRIRPGMYAGVKMHISTEEVMLIPDIAVLTLPGTNQKYVYILEDGKAVHRLIKVGTLVGQELVITEGLSISDRIITTGLSSIKNGEVIEAI
ncbi:efflux RND transporter periplasmic adaptor subunit [Porphyromonas sp.]|uniref:efflux RND transporter periplasmic adaptor subunit n=1 Tax=Porphyromonas sp. TaxID=1924944 RepID=UPI0026DAE754|nr:efflux RND transporter periplasmic adaptor subunit [Porphyromonas sp.]MDO4695736.1 efflux RND transporter periplasmic adaptor subunit [Porphyromonas sp.]MDO4770377.1 efflux RND transporter periplasmic adaptor subunit [Porphyromonas sp.]